MNRRTYGTGFLCCMAGLLLQSCVVENETSSPESNLHVLMTSALNVEMARLNALSFELHQTQTELELIRQRRRNDLARTAGQLKIAAADIPAYSTSLVLSEEDEQLFRDLAEQLGMHAAALEQSAGAGQLQDLEAQMAALHTTCNTCHNLYRPR